MFLQGLKNWRQHRYYYTRILSTLRFITSSKGPVLYVGRLNFLICEFLEQFDRVYALVLDHDEGVESVDMSKMTVIRDHSAIPSITFRYLILNCSLGESDDINRDLQALLHVTDEHSRVIIYQHNHLWEWLLKAAASLGLKRKEKTQNWLSLSDLATYLHSAGFKPIRNFRNTLCPVRLLFLGPLINFLATLVPVFDFFKVDQFMIARNDSIPAQSKSLTICLTVRDEKDNIRPIVESLPEIAAEQEILFVEGHSADGTREEIERMTTLYPEKKIRVIGQPGLGQGDAIRVGFREAKGDVIVLYEGDGTSDANDIQYFYQAICRGRAEFIEGSRFVYPLSIEQMPVLNQMGNMGFAKWFSWLLGQQMTDVLSGIKAVTKDGYRLIDATWGFLGIEDPFGDFELLYGAARYGLVISEIPMKYNPRIYGHSKTRVFHHGWYLVKLAGIGFWIFRNSFKGETL